MRPSRDTASLSDSPIYKEIPEIGGILAGFTSFGGVLGFMLGGVSKSVWPEAGFEPKQWAELSATHMAVFALSVEAFSRLGA